MKFIHYRHFVDTIMTEASYANTLRLLFIHFIDPNFSVQPFEEAKAEAAEALINDVDDKGAAIQRPGILTDRLPAPYPNKKAAAAANNDQRDELQALDPFVINGSKSRRENKRLFRTYFFQLLKVLCSHTSHTKNCKFCMKNFCTENRSYSFVTTNRARWFRSAAPPDLSLMALARHGGDDYIFALLTGYFEPPAGVKVDDGKAYNPYFPGGVISMPQQLYDEGIEYKV
ncbi:unnamed protein product [Cylicostephanus goldi]|uniref:Uncharacterized protein n=1 Tax=Cylicostephanus goldi TaxID=71465 RepID=A0A3P6RSG5_CYLGO|nr:unnamed protein product [Cylicostephanus goldi]